MRLLFPDMCLGCGLLLRSSAAEPWLCRRCFEQHEPLDPQFRYQRKIAACFAFAGPLATAVARLKYEGELALAGPLGRLLGRDEHFLKSRDSGRPWDCVVPVPLHPLRQFIRGFNQAREIAYWAVRSNPHSARLEPRLLRRRRHTPAQMSLSASDRQRNVWGSFAAGRPEAVRGRRVLVVDDVTTTGATLRACMRVLAACEASEVGALALLRTVA